MLDVMAHALVSGRAVVGGQGLEDALVVGQRKQRVGGRREHPAAELAQARNEALVEGGQALVPARRHDDGVEFFVRGHLGVDIVPKKHRFERPDRLAELFKLLVADPLGR